ncbi:MAG TPA: AMP-binding protein [Candidatus Limnocylindrales bacterium]|nr:AMP-binding protein [Candidatus Limnocylindrales bacterium]
MSGVAHLGRLAEATLNRLGDYKSLFFEGTWYTSAELHERARLAAFALREQGVVPGSRVVVVMTNSPDVTVTYHALWRAGAVVVPAIFLLTPPELQHIVTDSGAVAVVASPELLPKLQGLSVPVLMPPDLVSDDELAIVDCRPDDMAALLYTGGTTGRSKGVPLTHEQLIAGGGSVRQVTHVPGVNIGVLALPLAHSYGILVTVAGMHAEEPPVTVLQRWFDAPGWLALAEQHGAHAGAVVPSMLAMLLAQPLENYDLSRLRYVSCGAAPLSAALIHEFERRVPSATVQEGYGCTETAGIISATRPGQRKLGTVGQAIPGVEIRIVSAEGADLPPGEDGEIVVRGPNVMYGYLNGDPVGADGWFATGDIGHLDEDGFLSIVDRKKDLIIRGGINVFPRDVEDVMLAHPAVAAAAVVGRPDERLGEEVVAFVSLRPEANATVDDLITYAKENLSPMKYPREIRVLEAIPLTSVGKIDRKRVRAMLEV